MTETATAYRPGRISQHQAVGLLIGLMALFTSCNGIGGAPTQVGSNLNIPPNSGVTCQDGFPIQVNATFPQPFYLQGAQSCLVMTFFDGAQPSVPGTVVSANIRVGNITGPMRFVRMRILFTNGFSGYDRACCSAEQYGTIFTPTANAVTNVPLNFPMTHDRTPSDATTLAAVDLVGLEVLAPNVPIPGSWTQNGGPQVDLPTYAYFPALSARLQAPTSNLRSDGSYSGFLPSYNLVFSPR